MMMNDELMSMTCLDIEYALLCYVSNVIAWGV